MLLSIIVPVYNVKDYVEKCLASIEGQIGLTDYEAIVVDDGSTDGSGELVDDFCKGKENFRVIHKENGGLSSARNAGLDVATGDYIAFLDGDDWVESKTYENMINMALQNKLDIVCCEGVKIDGKEILERCFKNYPTGTVSNGREITKKMLLDEMGSQVVQGLYAKKCWNDLRFPIGRLYEDIPTTFKAFAKAEKIGFIAEPYYNYRMNLESISHKPNPLTSYHMYLGFKEHYDYAKVNFPEIKEACCAKACHYAVSTYFHYCTDAKTALTEYKADVCDFLDKHKTEIDFNHMPTTRKLALKAYFLSKGAFKLFCTLFYKTGLQKALHFDIK